MNGANHWYPGTRPRNFLANTRREESNAYGAKRYGEREYKYDKSSAKLRLIRPIEWIGPSQREKSFVDRQIRGANLSLRPPPPPKKIPAAIPNFARRKGKKGKKGEKKNEETSDEKVDRSGE